MKNLNTSNKSDNPIVFIDIGVNDESTGRVVIELFKNKTPKTAENFRALCIGEKKGASGKSLHYKGSIFHKLVPHLMIQGGDIINYDGSSGESIYGHHFEDENLKTRHDTAGLLTMVNEGKPNTNSSQFVITMSACPQLNNTNVVFGKIIKGLGTITELNNLLIINDKPVDKISIIDCGDLTNCPDWGIEESDGTEDVYTPYPEDWNYSTYTSKLNYEFILEIVNRIKRVGNACYASKNYIRAERKYLKALRYYEWMMKLDDIPSDENNFENLKTAMLLNLAAVKLHQKKYRESLHYCNQVLSLDNSNIKAFFRRSQAHVGMNEYQVALEDLKKASEIDPHDKEILKEIEKVKSIEQVYLAKEKAACKKMFKFE